MAKKKYVILRLKWYEKVIVWYLRKSLYRTMVMLNHAYPTMHMSRNPVHIKRGEVNHDQFV